MRVYSTSEKLLRWEKENRVEKGLPIPTDKRDWWLEAEGGRQEGARKGPPVGCGLPAAQPGWGQGVAKGRAPPGDGERSCFQYKNKYI